MIKLFEAFAGYVSQTLALKRLKESFPDFEFECVGWSEIDKYAIEAHNILHPEDEGKNYGDISEVDWSSVPDFDFFTYSFPCTDVSNAGLQKGLSEDSNTRSSLVWECKKAIEAKRPKYLMLENVKALVSKKFLPEFNRWLQTLEGYGYTNHWKVLNAKDYGIPQNRERVFVFSFLDKDFSYEFPKPFPLEKFLEDMLEENVDEKYYLSEQSVEGSNSIMRIMAKDRVIIEGYLKEKHLSTRVINPEGIVFTRMAMTHGWGQGYIAEYERSENNQLG